MRLQDLLRGLFGYVIIHGNTPYPNSNDVIAEGYPCRLLSVLPYKYLHAKIDEWYEDYDYIEQKSPGRMWYHREYIIIHIDAMFDEDTDKTIVEVPW